MKFRDNVLRMTKAGVIAGLLVTGLSAGVAGASTSHATHPDGLYAPMGPTDHPNYINPYSSGAYFTVTNMNDFQAYMYRPLYWVGKGSDITIQKDLSLAALPVYSNGNKTVTIQMKGWHFSDGTVADAKSALFFLNLYKVLPARYAGYVPGYGIPDQVSNVTANGNTLVITTSTAVNPNWFTYNFLTEITPLPSAWDRTSTNIPGANGTDSSAGTLNADNFYSPTGTANCAGTAYSALPDANPAYGYVTRTPNACGFKTAGGKYGGAYGFIYYNAIPARESSYQTNPMWDVVDGPYKLFSFNATGNVVFAPNGAYDGPQKASLKLTLVAETDIATETAQLEAGQLTSGYVLPTNVTPGKIKGTTVVPGTNLLKPLQGKFTVRSGGSWAFYYAYYNFHSQSSGTHLPNLLAFRQAMQDGIDQVTIIHNLYNGYGVPGYGPIPTIPANAFSGGLVNHYAYSIANGKKALNAAGFTGTTAPWTCTKTGGCGDGIPKGTPLTIKYEWATGSPTQDHEMAAEIAAWASEGIHVIPVQDTPDNVAALCTSGPGSGPSTTDANDNGDWQICQYGGWLYAPDYYPSGELLFGTGALSNPGEYSDTKMDNLIQATTIGTAALNAKNGFAQYAMDQLPYMYQPTGTGTGEISNALKGVLPVSPTSSSLPEYLHW